MDTNQVISVDSEIMNSLPVFKGTRVPIETLFDHLESGMSLDEFLDDFPSVSKKQAVALLEMASHVTSERSNIIAL